MSKKKAAVATVEPQVATEDAPTRQYSPIDTVYLITHGGLEIRQGVDALKAINEIRQCGDDTPYRFHENGRPFYIGVQNGNIGPLTFPEPQEYGTTASNLYAMAVTCANAIAEFIKLQIRGKPTLASQLRQIGVLAMPLVVTIFLIFILAVYIGS